MKIQIINGANLNLLGVREPEIYGNLSFETYFEHLKEEFPTICLKYSQSNCEGKIIDLLQEAAQNVDGIILNAGAYTHTSIAILDCIRSINVPVIEVHLSNIFARESFRHKSIISSACKGMISGFKMNVYKLAILAFLNDMESDFGYQ